MSILGIVDTQCDCGVSLIKENKIVSSINEERVVRKKLIGGFPYESLEELLNDSGESEKDIEKIVVGGILTPPWFARKIRYIQKLENSIINKKRHTKLVGKLSDIAQNKLFLHINDPTSTTGQVLRKFIPSIFRGSLPEKLKKKELYFINHHLAHTASAYYTQDRSEVLAITADAKGDGVSLTINHCKNREIKVLQVDSAFNSYAHFYGLVTAFLGFQMNRHEGKVVGLAAYGDPNKIVTEFPFENRNNKIKYKSKWGESGLKYLRENLKGNTREDIASWLQTRIEENVTRIVRFWANKTGLRDVVLAGGLFANVKLNQNINEMPEVNSVYVFPQMGDGGLALGASLAYLKPGPQKLKSIYLGPEYSDKEIYEVLKTSGLKYYKSNNIEKEVARCLADGKVVARFNGRMEYGPRALGNRSMLYQTTDPSANKWLNKKLKRTEFMPFAPTTMWEYRDKCYEYIKGSEHTARHMTITFNCTTFMKNVSPGVVHVDGTARPQLLEEKDNPSFYRIIKEYHKITANPSIINTSFNMHEDPIVMTPKGAIKTFENSKLECLAIGPFMAG